MQWYRALGLLRYLAPSAIDLLLATASPAAGSSNANASNSGSSSNREEGTNLDVEKQATPTAAALSLEFSDGVFLFQLATRLVSQAAGLDSATCMVLGKGIGGSVVLKPRHKAQRLQNIRRALDLLRAGIIN